MNISHRHIIPGIILMLSVGVLSQACSDEEIGGAVPDQATLIKQGRYLTARSVGEGYALEDYGQPFPVGTPYRLLAFVKPDQGTDDPDASALATHPRFNKIAWEGDTGGLRYFNISGDADKWFGFSAIGDENGGADGRVSIDFYGFTYGNKAGHTADYIELDGLAGETTPAAGSLETLRRTERVTDGNLVDLRWGKLLNQSISTTTGADAPRQSVIPFRHSFSQLQFRVVQQPDEDGNPNYDEVYVDNIDVTGTYMEGSVYLHNGKVLLPDKDSTGKENKGTRTLKMTRKEPVTTDEVLVGEMIVFPSAGKDLMAGTAATTDEKGYIVGLDITLKSPIEKEINNFLAKAGSTETATQGEDGYWYGVIRQESIINNITNGPLYFRQEVSYTLVISLQEDAVRIITVIPLVEEWLPGEDADGDQWQEHAIGQPQMFDNILWSDRNLGADHFDPLVNFEYTIGYFYQAGRNIPYYPFNTTLYTCDGKQDGPVPTPEDKHKNTLAGQSGWGNTIYRLYPMVDSRILFMQNQRTGGQAWGSKTGNVWSMSRGADPQMFIPETKPANSYFDFMRGNTNDLEHDGFLDTENMYWEKGPLNQPVAGAWEIPSSDDFLSIFPSTPFAGNITFRDGGRSERPMDWGVVSYGRDNAMRDEFQTLRVTIPYYVPGMSEPSPKSSSNPNGRNPGYIDAWRILDKYDAVGTTHSDAYYDSYNSPKENAGYEPDGDPAPGYASVYVISREEGSVGQLHKELMSDTRFKIKSWGTIYAIKRIYTSEAYRMRWRVVVDPVLHGEKGENNNSKKYPGMFIEVCRYRCNADDDLTEENYKTKYDWEHPAARLYFPICGLGDWTGAYINFGTECQYATSDPIIGGKTGAVQIKITGDNESNAYISVVKWNINRHFGMQIRPMGVKTLDIK